MKRVDVHDRPEPTWQTRAAMSSPTVSFPLGNLRTSRCGSGARGPLFVGARWEMCNSPARPSGPPRNVCGASLV
jgi:hypothetical protein